MKHNVNELFKFISSTELMTYRRGDNPSTQYDPKEHGPPFADISHALVWISVNISLNLISCPIYNKSELFQVMAWPHGCDKSLSEPMLINIGAEFHQNLVKTFE